MQEKIDKLINQAIMNRIFPGAVVAYVMDGSVNITAYGYFTYAADSPAVTIDTIYDVASVTKVLPTSTLAMQLIEDGKMSLDDAVKKYLPGVKNTYAEQAKIRHLLNYTYALDIPRSLTTYALEGYESLNKVLFDSPLLWPPGKRFLYSNAPMILLGMAIENAAGVNLYHLAERQIFSPLTLTSVTFTPGRLTVPPTEINSAGTIQGEVHDETARTLQVAGACPGNAGLFCNAKDLIRFTQIFLNDEDQILSQRSINLMTSNQNIGEGHPVGLGWEIDDAAFMGTSFEGRFGKTGFTGVSIVGDKNKSSAVILLSNRTFPKRPADGSAISAVRNRLADIVLG